MPKRFNRYHLDKQIASKLSESVYLAHRVNYASQKVVLKIFEASYFISDQQSHKFLQRAKRIKQLRHPSILSIQDFGIEQERPYIVREYLASSSLDRHLDRLSPQRLSLQQALTIISQVGQALSYAHEHHILHGNIKPENIFFNSNGEALLADFGLVNFTDMMASDLKSDLPTLSYLAPEQFVGSLTEKSDQYALACLAYKLITGRVPFSARDFSSMWAKQSTEPPIPLSDLIPNLPQSIEEAVLKAMAKDPFERHANISLFLSNLQTASLSLTSVGSSSLVDLSSNTLATTETMPPEKIKSQAQLAKVVHTTQRESKPQLAKVVHTTQRESEPHLAKAVRKTQLESEPHLAKAVHKTQLESEPYVEQSLREASLAMRLAERPEHAHGYNEGKALVTPSGNTPIETLPQARPPQSGKPLPPTLWLAFALSGIVLLLGTLILYTLVPSRPPGSIEPVKSSPTPVKPTPTSTSLTGSYANQTNQIYNLTTEGTLDWIAWGLNEPGDVNHKSGVQQQISPFSINSSGSNIRSGSSNTNNANASASAYASASGNANASASASASASAYAYAYAGAYGNGNNNGNGNIGSGNGNNNGNGNIGSGNGNNNGNGNIGSGNGTSTVQRVSYSSNAKIWWSDGTPVTTAQPQQASGVYVEGINNGFTFNVPASTTPRTLKVYVGANGARGEFTASLNGKAYIDETLNATYNPNGPQASGIYTLVFNSSASNQVLTVTYTAVTTDSSNGYVMLEAATLH